MPPGAEGARVGDAEAALIPAAERARYARRDIAAPPAAHVALDSAPAVRPARPRALAELLLTGGLTPFLFAASWLLRRSLGLDAAELAVGFLFFHAAHVINDPHFAVTYLLFYRRARLADGGRWQRARWIGAGVVVPIVLATWAAIALSAWSPHALGLLVQLMFALVGWHYVKQGFGVMLALAARRGVRFDARERLALLAHAIAGWAYAWCNPADPGTEVEEKGVVFTTIARSPTLERVALAMFLASTAWLAIVLVRKRMREGALPIATPLVAFVASIWAWSIGSSADPLVVYAVPALHSVQYLYFVWLMKTNQAREREGPPHFELSARVRVAILAATAIALGVFIFHVAPSALDGWLVPRHVRGVFDPVGATPYLAAITALVNIHHYFMDAVIWRRENPETSYLVAGDRHPD